MYPENGLFAEYETSCVQLLNLKKIKEPYLLMKRLNTRYVMCYSSLNKNNVNI